MPMTQISVLPDAGRAGAHTLHAAERLWPEKNCYVDLWIELLHAQGLEPLAMLPFVLGLDFEGDQFTFFKPPLADLRTLYGIDVQELTLWRPLVDHAVEHLGAGKLIAVEVDAFWLPDTAGTDYRQAHAKTTVVLNQIDTARRRLGYVHNAGRFVLEGDDFEALFAPARPTDYLPPYAELIRLDRVVRHSDATLRALSERLLQDHFAGRPTTNPIERYRARYEADLPALQQAGLAHYHRWAFAGVRQLGAAFELAALCLRWLRPGAEPTDATDAFERIAQHAKTLLLKTARAVHSGRAPDTRALFDAMTDDWAGGMAALAAHR